MWTLRFGASERGCCLMAFADTFLFAFLFAMQIITVETYNNLRRAGRLTSSDASMPHLGHLDPRAISKFHLHMHSRLSNCKHVWSTRSRHDMSRGPAPGPVSVLRGHQSDVQALAFHPGLDVLYSG